jgi:tRNA U34 5-carboxymethylaminomethyl modifying enzyme MnmG/GidA
MRGVTTASKLLKRQEIDMDDWVCLGLIAPDPYVLRQIEIKLKYEGYIDRPRRGWQTSSRVWKRSLHLRIWIMTGLRAYPESCEKALNQ